MKKNIRKFTIGDKVRRTSTGEVGIVTAYDMLPEVYAIRKEAENRAVYSKAIYAMWGEPEMEAIATV